METLPKLTSTQALLLRAAARRADGRMIPPANLRGGARVKEMTGLTTRTTTSSAALTSMRCLAIWSRRPSYSWASVSPIQILTTF